MNGRLRFTIELDGITQIDEDLNGYLGRVTDLSKLWRRIIADWQESRRQVFAAEGAYDGGERWEELAPAYARRKAASHPGQPILQREGELVRAATQPEEEIAEDGSGLRLTVSTGYAIYHQSRKDRHRLPRRAFWDLGAAQKRRWLTFLREHLWAEE